MILVAYWGGFLWEADFVLIIGVWRREIFFDYLGGFGDSVGCLFFYFTRLLCFLSRDLE